MDDRTGQTGSGGTGGGAAGSGTGRDDSSGRRSAFSDGIRQGLGVLSAFKEALEETIQEARDRGELSSDRAREVMRGAMDRARAAADEAKERFDFVSHEEFDALRERVEELRVRLENVERRSPQGPGAGPASGEQGSHPGPGAQGERSEVEAPPGGGTPPSP